MPNCAVVDSSNTVINIIVADPNTDIPPENTILIEIPFCNIGYTWDGTKFNPPQS
jgi:hypothetical protein